MTAGLDHNTIYMYWWSKTILTIVWIFQGQWCHKQCKKHAQLKSCPQHLGNIILIKNIPYCVYSTILVLFPKLNNYPSDKLSEMRIFNCNRQRNWSKICPNLDMDGKSCSLIFNPSHPLTRLWELWLQIWSKVACSFLSGQQGNLFSETQKAHRS